MKEAIANPSVVADVISKADNYSERAGRALAEKAPVTAEALQAFLGLEVKSVIENPTAVKEIINGGGNLASASANRTKMIVNSAEFKGQQQAIQAEANRLAEQAKALLELQGSTSPRVTVTPIATPTPDPFANLKTTLVNPFEGLKAKLNDTLPLQKTVATLERPQTTDIMRATTSSVAPRFRELIDRRNFGDAEGYLNGFIGDAKQLPEGAFKEQASKILEENDLQLRLAIGLTPEKLKSVGNQLIDVLVGYEASLKSATTKINRPSLSIETLVEELLENRNPALIGQEDKIREVIAQADKARNGLNAINQVDETRIAENATNGKFLEESTAFLEKIIKQAKLADAETQFQQILEKGTVDEIRDFNAQIQALKQQLGQ